MICTTAMCANGRASVQQMRRTFNLLSGNPNFPAARFEPRVLEIEQTLDDVLSVVSDWIPFNPACCTATELGKQADSLIDEMNRAAGVVTSTGTSSGNPEIDVQSLVTLGALAVGVMFLGNLQAVTRRA